MPKKLTTPEEIEKAWEKKRERDRKAQAKWVGVNRELHRERMKEQYRKKKEKKAEAQKKAEEDARAGVVVEERKEEVVVPVVEEKPKECEIKEVPAGLSLLDVVKRIRNSYYASQRNKAGWKGKSEEEREKWKADFKFCDDLIAKNEDKLTAEQKAELTKRGIALTDPRLIAKELDEGMFTAPLPAEEKPKVVRRKIRVMVPKEEPAPAPVVEEKKAEPEPEKPKRRKLRLAVPKEEVFSPQVDELPSSEENNTDPISKKRDDRGAIYHIKDILNEYYREKRKAFLPSKYRNKPAPQWYRDAHPEQFPNTEDLPQPPDDFFVKELPKRLTRRQLHEITQKVYHGYVKEYLVDEDGISTLGRAFYITLRRLMMEYRKAHGLGDYVFAVEKDE